MSSVSENDLKRFTVLLQTSHRYVCESERGERRGGREEGQKESIISKEKANDPMTAGRKVHISKEELIEGGPTYSDVIHWFIFFSL